MCAHPQPHATRKLGSPIRAVRTCASASLHTRARRRNAADRSAPVHLVPSVPDDGYGGRAIAARGLCAVTRRQPLSAPESSIHARWPNRRRPAISPSANRRRDTACCLGSETLDETRGSRPHRPRATGFRGSSYLPVQRFVLHGRGLAIRKLRRARNERSHGSNPTRASDRTSPSASGRHFLSVEVPVFAK